MKLESESIYAHASLATRPDTKIFSYDDNCMDTGWKVKNDIMGEDKRKVVSDGDIKKFETTPVSLEEFVEVESLPRAHDILSKENPINEGKECDDFRPNSITVSEKENKLYTDKVVTELELPEFEVCFNGDEDFHVVKDICIDDGLPSLSKALFEEGDICSSQAFNSTHSDLDVNNDVTEENGKNAEPLVKGTNPFVECDSNIDIDIASKYGVETSDENGKEYINETVNVGNAASIFSVTNPFVECDSRKEITEKFGSNTLSEDEDKGFYEKVDHEVPVLHVTNPFLEFDSEEDVAEISGSHSRIGDHEEDLDEIVNVDSDEKTMPETLVSMQKINAISSSEPFSDDKNEDQEQTDEDGNKEEHPSDSMTPTAEKLDDCSQIKVHFDSQVESLGISYSSDSSSPETSGKEEDIEYTDRQRSGETLSMPIIDEEKEENQTASRVSFSSQYGFGETSFSAVGPLSDPISYSGQIPFSGSVSYRSDSSTTSTRSFAFPVLNTEWSSSPVRMVKADKRQFQKHRGWRALLLCCRY